MLKLVEWCLVTFSVFDLQLNAVEMYLGNMKFIGLEKMGGL